MNKFSQRISNILGPIANKFASQRYLVAIRDAFIAVMPLVIVSSFFILLNNVVIDSKNGLLRTIGNFDVFKEIGNNVYSSTLGFLSVFLAFGIAYKLAQRYDMDPLGTAFISLASLLSIMPSTLNMTDGTKMSGVFIETYTSPKGLFVAILISLLATELLRLLSEVQFIKIKMPDMVPDSVTTSFNILIPACITITFFSVLGFIIIKIIGLNIYQIITNLIQAPVKAVFQGLPGLIIVLLLQNLLWGFGLHGAFILSPITEPTLLTAIQENMDAYNSGLDIPNIVTKPFLDAFAFSGGGGFTIGLVIAILIFSRRQDYRSIGKLSLVPSIFNINEPLMFGLPVVLNPILMIPLVLVPVVNIVIAYYATSIGLISKTVIMVPWTTPPILSAYLATGGDGRAAILSIGLIIISIFLYMPFVVAANAVETEEY